MIILIFTNFVRSKLLPAMKYININKFVIVLISILIFGILNIFSFCSPSRNYLLKQNATGVDKLFIRILLKKTDGRVLVSSKTKLKIKDNKTGIILYNDRGKDIYYQPEQIINPVAIESLESPIIIDNERYRGSIEIHNILGKIQVINILQINEYLYSVVPGEIISTWEMEALKAQAVAARTYTYHHLVSNKKAIYDLDNSSNFQVYKGIAVEKESTNRAVDETSGKIALYFGKPIIAFFHSTCGGKTMDDKFVWNGEGQEYLKSVICPYCKESPYFNWEEKITLYEIKDYLGKKYKGIGQITGVSFQRKEDRVVSTVVHHKNGIVKLTGNELRLLFPEKKIKSLFFTAKKVKDGLILTGHGWGHGVGMCQWGAKGMAEKGADYKSILRYYYKGISISDFGQRDYAGR
jgi:stage II sporulation protein D